MSGGASKCNNQFLEIEKIGIQRFPRSKKRMSLRGSRLLRIVTMRILQTPLEGLQG
jgi:hypothetical protein